MVRLRDKSGLLICRLRRLAEMYTVRTHFSPPDSRKGRLRNVQVKSYLDSKNVDLLRLCQHRRFIFLPPARGVAALWLRYEILHLR